MLSSNIENESISNPSAPETSTSTVESFKTQQFLSNSQSSANSQISTDIHQEKISDQQNNMVDSNLGSSQTTIGEVRVTDLAKKIVSSMEGVDISSSVENLFSRSALPSKSSRPGSTKAGKVPTVKPISKRRKRSHTTSSTPSIVNPMIFPEDSVQEEVNATSKSFILTEANFESTISNPMNHTRTPSIPAEGRPLQTPAMSSLRPLPIPSMIPDVMTEAATDELVTMTESLEEDDSLD